MIIDSLEHAYRDIDIHKDMKNVFQFLSQIDLETETGKYVLREGEVWINILKISEGIPEDSCVFEAHRDFIDIQFILHGEEIFGYSNIDRLQVKEPYCAKKDCELLEGDAQSFVMKSGDFCVLFPHDAHIPDLRKLNDGDLIRVVAKVKLK